MNIHEFIEEFRSVIVASVGRDSNPLYHPGTDRKKIYQLIKSLPRRPIASQVDAIGGIVHALRFRDSAILVGEMGLGQDLHLHCRGSRSRIHKDSRRLSAASREQVAARGETNRAHGYCAGRRENRRPRKSAEGETRFLFVILSREKAKLGYYWKGHATRLKDGELCLPQMQNPAGGQGRRAHCPGSSQPEEAEMQRLRGAPVGRRTQVVRGASPSPLISRTSTPAILICSSPTSATNTKARPRPRESLWTISARRRDRFSRSPEPFSAATAQTFSISFSASPRTYGRISSFGTSRNGWSYTASLRRSLSFRLMTKDGPA